MLNFFRNLSKSIVGKVILVLFVVMIFASFALADISGFGGGALGGGSSALVETGDEQVSDRDFSMGMERVLASARQQNPEATYATVAGNGRADQPVDRRRRGQGLRARHRSAHLTQLGAEIAACRRRGIAAS